MRILLVEVDPVLREVMRLSLRDAGHRVDEAGTLEQAAHFWRVQPFDAVLLDLNLPQSDAQNSPLANGLTLLREARARRPHTCADAHGAQPHRRTHCRPGRRR